MSAADESPLWHQSGVSARDGKPFVQLLLGDRIIGQMTTEEARDHARAITEAAEAAEQDAFLIDFAKSELGMNPEQSTMFLLAFRNYRQKTGKSQGPRNPKDWVMPGAPPS